MVQIKLISVLRLALQKLNHILEWVRIEEFDRSTQMSYRKDKGRVTPAFLCLKFKQALRLSVSI